MKLIQRTILPFDQFEPENFWKWHSYIMTENREIERKNKCKAVEPPKIEEVDDLVEALIMEALVDQAYEILIFNAKRN